MGIKVLGKDPDNLHEANTAALLEKQLAILCLSDEGAEGLGLFKVYSTPASHQSGTGWGLSTVLDVQLPHTADGSFSQDMSYLPVSPTTTHEQQIHCNTSCSSLPFLV